MSDTTSRALSLLTLLQTHRSWPGPELAARLGVSERTVRRDVERLRELGYRVESSPGIDGGYRLEAGSAVPPLLLSDEEAVTIAVGLRVAATQRLVDGPQTTLTALAKLEQVLPTALRRRVNALAAYVQPKGPEGPLVSPDLLGELALACRDRERIRFAYTAADGARTRRRVDPCILVPAEQNWYLLAWDLDREDWRTFRVDRLSGLFHTRATFAPRQLPAEDVADYVAVAIASVPQPIETEVIIDLPLEQMQARFGPWAQGATETDDGRTRWPIGGGTVQELLFGLMWVPEGVGYEVELPAELRGEIRDIAERMLRAVGEQTARSDESASSFLTG